MNTIKRLFRRHKLIVTIIAAVLITALTIGFLSSSTNLISSLISDDSTDSGDRNPDNLIGVEFYKQLDGDEHAGVKISVDDDGVITLNGNADVNFHINLKEGDLDSIAGMNNFLFFSGCPGGSLETYHLTFERMLTSTESNNVVYPVFDNGQAVVHTENSVDFAYIIRIDIKEGTEFNNVKIYPVLSSKADTTFFK